MEEPRIVREMMDIGREKGLEMGLEKGLEMGRLDESRRILRRLVLKQFRDLPDWLEKWTSGQTTPEAVEQVIESLLDVTKIGDLKSCLPQPSLCQQSPTRDGMKSC